MDRSPNKSPDPLDSCKSGMEINNHYSHIPRKDLPAGAPLLRGELPGMQTDTDIQTHLLKQQHQIEHEMLLRQFHEQQIRLQQEQEKQMQDHIQVQMLMIQKRNEYLEQQKKIEEQQRLEREHAELERLQQIKNKKKEDQSAVASNEVKMKLQEFVLSKKQRDMHSSGGHGNSPPQFKQWATTHHSSLEQQSPPQSGLSPPYRPHHLLRDNAYDFPLRKTVSDSNLKVRSKLKEKVVQRSSPLLRRKNIPTKRKPPLSIDTTVCNSNPDSGPNTPPSSHHTSSNNSSGEVVTPQDKLDGRTFPLQLMSKMVINQSMPNISIGLPRDPTSSPDTTHNTNAAQLAAMSEAELQARVVHSGMPMPTHMLPGGPMPYFPSLPVIDSEFTPPNSPAYISAQMKSLEQARSSSKLGGGGAVPAPGAPYSVPCSGSEAQGSQSRLHRRPLNRTHSAPLPLGRPLLNQPFMLPQHEQLLKENQKLYLKQRLQSTVLQRAGSKSQMGQVDEEAEARLAQEMREIREKEEDDVVVIGDDEPMSVNPTKELVIDVGGPGDQEVYPHPHQLHHPPMRELVRQHAICSSSPPAAIMERPPLERAQSSPAVGMPLSPKQTPEPIQKLRYTTGLAYDTMMLKHTCACGDNNAHPEHPGRLQSIWARLHETGLVNRCERVKCRKATLEELQTCHSESYSLVYGTSSLNRQKLSPEILETLPARFCLLPCGGVGVDSDTVWNELHTASAVRMAVGCVSELAFRVASGELKNGMAIVRPPGHHAESDLAMGFCYFNSLAIATKLLRKRLQVPKVLIVDWDVHHGNSTQQIFYDDPNVLYLSVHRHDSGNFFPGTGAPEDCGSGEGLGFNVNVAFAGALSPPMGDAEYLAAFRCIVMPIAREFNPDVVMVSAGFDAALGHPPPLGGYQLSSECFGHLTKQLMTLANGKIVLVLEGGYDLPAICDSSEICVQALLGEEIPPLREEERRRRPCEVAVETLKTTVKFQGHHWPCIHKHAGTMGFSSVEAHERERDEADTVSAFASLSVVQEGSPVQGIAEPAESAPATSEPMEES